MELKIHSDTIVSFPQWLGEAQVFKCRSKVYSWSPLLMTGLLMKEGEADTLPIHKEMEFSITEVRTKCCSWKVVISAWGWVGDFSAEP